MADDRGTVHQIAWQDVFPATILLSTLRLAISFRALAFATLGYVAMTGGWSMIGKAFPTEAGSDLGRLKEKFNALSPWNGSAGGEDSKADHNAAAEPDANAAPDAQAAGSSAADSPQTGFEAFWDALSLPGPLIQAWRLISMPFVELMNFKATFTQFAYLLACALWSLAVWAFFGGAITRITAVSLAREEQVSIGQAASFACSKWAAYFTAPLFPLFGVVLLSLPLALVGLLLRFNLGIVIAGILWPIALVLGVFMAVLLVVLYFGWPLMWATISTEGTDSFDALSRSYAYTCQRPLHYLLYAVLAALLGALGVAFVFLFAGAVINLSHWAVSWGSSASRLEQVLHPPADGSISPTGSSLINFWIGCVGAVAVGFMFSYLWTASTAIYLLLRRQVDATETDEVYMAEQEQLFGMPPLKNDAAGVPGPADIGSPAGNGGAA